MQQVCEERGLGLRGAGQACCDGGLVTVVSPGCIINILCLGGFFSSL